MQSNKKLGINFSFFFFSKSCEVFPGYYAMTLPILKFLWVMQLFVLLY